MAGRRASPARRYAEAAFELAERDGNVDLWLAQLGDLAQAVSGESVVRHIEDPNIPVEERLTALLSALQGDAVPQLVNMARLLLRRRRADDIRGIYREFRRLYNRRTGIVEASATSAVALDEQEVAALRSRLEQMTGSRIELETQVDPSILGGVQVRLGDLLIDGSVRGRLERLRNRLASGALTP